MKEEKPIILVTNDDGITSPGIKALVTTMQELGTVVVVAPDKPQSSKGYAITIGEPLRLKKVDIFENVEAYQCTGTPVDCVKLAVSVILKRKPDLCVAGINHGINSSINVIYSGTMSAAMEGSIEGINGIGFSVIDNDYDVDLTVAKIYCKKIASLVLDNGLPEGVLLNVNMPENSSDGFKGIKICRQANAKWEEEFDQRTDPRGQNYYWLTGKFVNHDNGEDTDEWALKNGYVSVVPIQYDLTAYKTMDVLKKNWEL